MKQKIACITGSNGQTGSFLCEKLLDLDYKVYGMVRKSSVFTTERIDHLMTHPNFNLSYGDLSDSSSIVNLINKAKPDEFYNMAALSHVGVSYSLPELVTDIDANGVTRCLEAIRLNSPTTRFLQASTSELFGTTPAPQNEQSLMQPTSPYGCAKLFSYWMTKNYRENYKLFAVNSISFNHESFRRSPTFITTKVVQAGTRIKYGLQNELLVGNLHAKRSWNSVKDIIDGMHLMMTADKPDDYVIGDNPMMSVQDFIYKVFAKLNIDPKQYVKVDSKYIRPGEVPELEPDSSKIKKELGWVSKYSVDDIIDEMITHFMEEARKEKLIKDNSK